MPHYKPSREPPWYKTPAVLIYFGFMGIAAFFLIMEHRAHLYKALPFLIILICPLMHFFMHGQHSDHHHTSKKDNNQRL